MTEDTKTTYNVPPSKSGPLYELAEELGFKRANTGNVSAMLMYLIQMVELYGPRVVAAALQPERLAEVAGTLEQEE